MKSSRYMDRAMRSRDPRFARILGRLGHEPTKVIVDASPEDGTRRIESVETIETPPTGEPADAREPVDAATDAPGKETAPVKPESPAAAEKPAKPARPAKKQADDDGSATRSRKKTAKGGRYKTRAMKAED
jgi:hypothetical protein